MEIGNIKATKIALSKYVRIVKFLETINILKFANFKSCKRYSRNPLINNNRRKIHKLMGRVWSTQSLQINLIMLEKIPKCLFNGC